MSKLSRLALVVYCLWRCTAVVAQSPAPRSTETGIPLVKWISPQEYEGTPQVFSVEQDDRGILYFGLSGGGLREYDGTSWRTIATPHGAIVRAMARGEDGRIYVGEVGDFGYLEPDNSGQMRFTSLLQLVPQKDRDFQDVRRIHSTAEGMYFQSNERLFLLTRQGSDWRIKVWKPDTRFRYSFSVFGTVYLAVTNVGLQKVNGDKLETIHFAEFEKTPERRVYVMLPYSPPGGKERQILLATGDSKFYLMDDSGLRPFAVEESPWENMKLAHTAAAGLPDGAFCFGKRSGGLLVMEHDGRKRSYLAREEGIASDGVNAVFSDLRGTVWLGLQNGLAKVEVSSPLSEFGRLKGLSAAVNSIIRHRGTLYTGTMAGLKYLDTKEGRFRPVSGLESINAFGLLAHPEGLLVAGASDVVFQVNGNAGKPAITLKPGLRAFTLAQSVQDPRRVWVGTAVGLAAIRRQGSQWVDEGLVAKTPEIRSIAEPEPGLLWLGTMSQGVVRIRLQRDSVANPEVRRFGKADGLPGDGGAHVAQAAGRVLFASPKGVREFDINSGTFRPSTLFSASPTGGAAEEYTVATDPNGNIWANFGVRPIPLLRQGDGSYKVGDTFVRRISDGMVQAMWVDLDSVVWMGAVERLFRFAPKQGSATDQRVTAMIRRVTAGDGEGKVIYDGGGTPAPPVIPYRDNKVRLEYALGSFEDPSRNQFQTKLEGFDADWSHWTTQPRRDYTNIPPGNFTFHVRARNMLGQLSTEAVYALEILPPWYRTWWAYLLYPVAAALLIWPMIRWRVRQLQASNQRLEEIVHERTEEIRRQRDQIQEQEAKTESLLLNILPAPVAAELRSTGSVTPMHFDDVTVCFTDFVGFTLSSETLEAGQLVACLHEYFTEFDRIISKFGLEKLKTIGDAYMFVSGLPKPSTTHALDAVQAALEIVEATIALSQREGGMPWRLRVGLHSGPVVAGVVGVQKFAFDIWGDTVNLASRMESSGVPNRVNLSARTYQLVCEQVTCESRGAIRTKDGRDLEMYFANCLLDRK